MLTYLRSWFSGSSDPTNNHYQDVPNAREAYDLSNKSPLYREIASGINTQINNGGIRYWYASRTRLPNEIIEQFRDKGYRVFDLDVPDPRWIYSFKWDFSDRQIPTNDAPDDH